MGRVDYKAIVPPRELKEDEISSLRTLLMPKLKVPNDSYQRDAQDLLDYALDMVAESKSVGLILEELLFMDMIVFDEENAEEFGHCLSAFLLHLPGDVAYVVPDTPVTNEDFAATDGSKIDLSTIAAAQKPVKEMEETLMSGVVSAKERSQQDMFDSDGVLIKQWDERDDDTDDVAVHGINLTAGAAAKRASREVDSLLYKKKSGGTLSDRLSSYQDFVKPRGNLHHEGDDHDEARMKSLVMKKPKRVVRALSGSGAAERKKELQAIMKDRSLSRDEKNKRMEEVKARYDLEVESEADNSSLDDQRTKEFNAIMQDRSLSRDERTRRIEEFKQKYQSGGRHHVHVTETPSRRENLDLSASAYARKPSAEVKATLLSSGVSAKERSKHDIYDEHGNMIKQWSSYQGNDLDEGETSDLPPQTSTFKTFMSKPQDEQKRQELHAIMRDRSLTRDERAARIEAVKARYTSGEQFSAPAEPKPTPMGPTSHDHGKNAELDDRRRRELKAVMKDRSLDKDEKNKMLEDIKIKYDALEAELDEGKEEETAQPEPNISENTELGERRRQELKAVMMDRSIGREEKTRMLEAIKIKYDTPGANLDQEETAIEPEAKVNEDSRENLDEEETAIEPEAKVNEDSRADLDEEVTAIEPEAKASEDSTVIEVNQDVGNVVPDPVQDGPIDLTAASFSEKHLNELEVIKSETSTGSSIKERMAAFSQNNTTVYYDSVSFAVSQNKSESARQMAQRDTVEQAKQYNYNYGDGGAVEKTSANLKAMGDQNKAAMKDVKETAKRYNYRTAPKVTIDCDPTAFAMKKNKASAARQAVQHDTKESAKQYNYRYTGS
jgi:hypothetical protein